MTTRSPKIVGNCYRIKGKGMHTIVKILHLDQYCKCQIMAVQYAPATIRMHRDHYKVGDIVMIINKCLCNTVIEQML